MLKTIRYFEYAWSKTVEVFLQRGKTVSCNDCLDVLEVTNYSISTHSPLSLLICLDYEANLHAHEHERSSFSSISAKSSTVCSDIFRLCSSKNRYTILILYSCHRKGLISSKYKEIQHAMHA